MDDRLGYFKERRMQVCKWAVLTALAGGALSAQSGAILPPSTDSTTQASLPYTVSTNTLLARGFNFEKIPRKMCSISGPDGPCHVEAFIGPEKTEDPEGFTCRKLDRATYLGRCVNGKLEGLSVVLADGSAKQTGEWFLTYLDKGRVAFPALTAYRDGNLMGVREDRKSYGCVNFGKWDQSATRDSCPKFIEIWGRDIFSEATLQSLRDGTFELNRYGPSFVKFIAGQ